MTNHNTFLKKCRNCSNEFPSTTEYFYSMHTTADGLYPDCRTCARQTRYAKTLAKTRRDGEKRCGHCQQWYPATHEYFGSHAGNVDGLHGWCKACASEIAIQRARARGAKANEAIRKDGKKRCPQCEEWLPNTLEYFHKSARRRDGLSGMCIPCAAKYQRLKRQLHGLPVRQIRHEGDNKQCVRCERWFPANSDYFYVRETQSDGLDYWCKTCHSEYARLNKHKFTARKQAYHRKYGSEHREAKRGYNKKYVDRHLARVRLLRVVNANRRRTRLRDLPDTFTLADWERCLDYFHHSCAACGRQLNDLFGTHKQAMDHWIPVASPDCPGTVAANIVPLCHGENGCNNRKRDRDPKEFLETEFGKRRARDIHERIQAYFNSLNNPQQTA